MTKHTMKKISHQWLVSLLFPFQFPFHFCFLLFHVPGTRLVLLLHQLANEFDLCNGRKALTSCQKQLHPVAISDDISVMLGGRLLPTRIQVQVNRASISPLTRPTSDKWKNSASACFWFCPFPAGHFNAKGHNYILITWLARELAVEPRYNKWVGTSPCWWSS